MKKFILSILCLISCVVITLAQPNLNVLAPGVSAPKSLANPYGNLVQASDGLLYGMTSEGGSNKAGIIFSLDPTSGSYTVIRNLDTTSGAYPYGSLVQASDGLLYGMTSEGGSSNAGVIFSLDPASGSYTVIKNFDTTGGAYPDGNLVQASDGLLYGMTYQGGSSYAGVIFSLDPASGIYTVLKNFDAATGTYPDGSLIQASDGLLYGVTSEGGTNNVGVIFSLDPASGIYNIIINLDKPGGAYPYGSLLQASDGLLYGMTSEGGSNNFGVIFSLDPASGTYTLINNFDKTNGAYPFGNLVQASDGLLYGMASEGGSNNAGVIFNLDPSSGSYNVINNFDKPGGAFPFGSLVQASDGLLYGMASEGGTNNTGVIFTLDPASGNYTVIKNFDDTSISPTPEIATNRITQIADMNEALKISNKLRVKVLSNPSYSSFTLQTQSNRDEPLVMISFDAAGRVIEKRSYAAANGTLMFGGNYRPGSYFTVIKQGTQTITVKLIKQ